MAPRTTDRATIRVDYESWRELAACKGVGSAAFFGPRTQRGRERCACCRVDEICFWYAMATEEEDGCRSGVWGDTTPRLRETIAQLIGPGYARRRLATLGRSTAPSERGRWREDATAV